MIKNHEQKITLGEMRSGGVRGLVVYQGEMMTDQQPSFEERKWQHDMKRHGRELRTPNADF